MKTNARGAVIVNVASANAVKAQSWTSVYAASKAAVLSLTRTTALHCAEQRYPIRVNAVLPGIVLTPMVERILDAAPDRAAALAGLESFHPIGRLLAPAEIASVVVFLSSPAASGITGAGIAVDGGMTAG
jgi:NAD(P)-dependent dehydrogenase (short-subunit alcohol dehydrogenase family)